MKLKISEEIIGCHGYTCKDILEDKHHNLYMRAEECCQNLLDWQTKVIALMPEAKQALPQPSSINSVEDLYRTNEQANIQSYVFLLSVFNFCDKVYTDLKDMCNTLAVAASNEDDSEEHRIYSDLDNALRKLSTLNNIISLTLIENRGITGMLRLLEMCNYIALRSFSAVGSYTFRDIIGTIVGQGYYDVGILVEATNVTTPTTPTVAGAADDEKLIRIH